MRVQRRSIQLGEFPLTQHDQVVLASTIPSCVAANSSIDLDMIRLNGRGLSITRMTPLTGIKASKGRIGISLCRLSLANDQVTAMLMKL